MRLDANRHSAVPIYAQLAEQVRHVVEVGGLDPGEKLLTVQRLAEELAIAPNTIVKAYNELQREGLVESKPGVGTVVAAGVAEVAKGRKREAVFDRLRALVHDAAALGVTEDDLWESLDSEFERLPRSS